MVLNILSELGFASKNILIRINSSVILDVIYDHFLKKTVEAKKLDETKINILLTISSLLNKRDTQYNINDLVEKLKKNNTLSQIPIPINELKALIKSYYIKTGKSIDSFDEKEKRLLLLYNRGARISAGVPEGFYDGYKREISEVFTYDIEEN